MDFYGNPLPYSANPVSSVYATAPGTTVTGSATAAQAIWSDGGNVLVGGAGDNTYYVYSPLDQIVEKPNGGVDTVKINGMDYQLPANVENLAIGGNGVAYGNSGANIIWGQGSGTQTIDGGAGNDLIELGTGKSTVIFDANSGHDAVDGFIAGAGHDVVSLGGYVNFTSFAQVQAAMTQVGSNVVLQLDANDAVLFRNEQISDFTASNFQLAVNTGAMKMTFDDEFNSLSLNNGTSGTWTTNFGYGATSNSLGSRTLTSNGEKEIYVDPTMTGAGTTALGLNPFSINNGVLSITASATPAADKTALYGYSYVSGLLTTKESFQQTYGYFDIDAKLPTGSGAWPAFWLLPADGSWPPELDVLEASNGTDTVSETAHSVVNGVATQDAISSYVPGSTTGFHDYGVLWTASTITWYVDGVQVAQEATPADMNKPMYMLIDLAISGSATSTPSSSFTSTMQVNYVRAYSLADSPVSVPATSTTGSSTPATPTSAPATSGTTSSTSTGASTTSTTTPATTPSSTPTTAASATSGTTSSTSTGTSAPATTTPATTSSSSSTTSTAAASSAASSTPTATQSPSATAATSVPTHAAAASALTAMAAPSTNGSLLETTPTLATLKGGAGNDVLVVNSGAAYLQGGAGDDVFVLHPGVTIGTQIADFTRSATEHDFIQLSGFSTGSSLVFASYSGQGTTSQNDALQYYSVEDANHKVEAQFLVHTIGGQTQLVAGQDFAFIDATAASTSAVPSSTTSAPSTPTPAATTASTPATSSGTLAASAAAQPSSSTTTPSSTTSSSPASSGIPSPTAGGQLLETTTVNHTLKGTAGNDVLIGGVGGDFLQGGAGDDTFVLEPGFTVGTQISDFTRTATEHDFLDLSGFGSGATLQFASYSGQGTTSENDSLQWYQVMSPTHSVLGQFLVHEMGSQTHLVAGQDYAFI
ncbi:family 16 glycosylhydrolase [Caulobacter sp. S45]|uniref:family 16 glycosylhydrolase n=1 Tax=Caulobacter sp. S45 TaxID=1641861 RepID=UPI00131D72C1|nr:family 16 glycosylhydrolase [Caulobacter sp. S45]